MKASPWIRSILVGLTFVLADPAQCFAKKVELTWKALKGAASYEIEFSGSLASQKVEEPGWKGELPYGAHRYRIRAIDRFGRAGQWSSELSLGVMPPSPQLVSPDDGAKEVLYSRSLGGIKFAWKPAPGVAFYTVDVETPSGRRISERVGSPPWIFEKAEAGKYRWKVTPWMEAAAEGATPKTWRGPPSRQWDFEVARQDLAMPTVIEPVGAVAPLEGGVVRFAWAPVEGAKGYELSLIREGAPPKVVQFDKPNARFRLGERGSFQWGVRAIASVDGAVLEKSGESRTTFKIDPGEKFQFNRGYVALSSLFSPYTYGASLATGAAESLVLRMQAIALIGRVSGEVWLMPRFGVGGAIESVLVQADDRLYTLVNAELSAKSRFVLGSGANGWVFQPRIGGESRAYPLIAPASLFEAGARPSFQLLGLSVGMDLRKQWGKRWSLALKAGYFFPLSGRLVGLVGSSLGSDVDLVLTGNLSLRNVSGGIQGAYWFGSHWALAIGTYLEQRSLSARIVNQADGSWIRTDGVYFFGSLIYSFSDGSPAAAARVPAGAARSQ